jgi:BASS family bile acid:Na+ symporter
MFNHYADLEYSFAAVQLVAFMLAMGAKLVPSQFLRVWENPRSFFVALGGHLVVIPFAAVAMNHIFGLESGLAVGLILVAAMPGGTLAKFFTYFGHGNVPLSITLSVVSTLLTLITIPTMLPLLTRGVPEQFELPAGKIMIEVAGYVLLPMILSMLLCGRFPLLKKPVERWGVRVGLILVITMIVGSLGSGRIKPGEHGWSAPLAIIFFCVLGQQINQLPFYLLRWPRTDRIAAGMEVTMRNMNLALLLWASLFRDNREIGNEVLFVVLFYAATALIVGLPLALRHRRMGKRELASIPASGSANRG